MRYLLLLGACVVTTAACATASSGESGESGELVDPRPAPVEPIEDDIDAPLADAGSALEDSGTPRTRTPGLLRLDERCKLINGRNLDDPTSNRTHFRANLRGTDLGIPVVHGNDVYFFFGDSVGYRGIWPFGPSSHPDAVGIVSHSAMKASPAAACSGLRFLLTSREASLGPTFDVAVERDFAGAFMTPPAGRSIAEFVRNPSGTPFLSSFPSLPGDFEVPTGAFSHAGSIYLFYSSVQSSSVVEMKGSYLARWTAPSPTGMPLYDILYDVDQRRDAAGALRGDFINISPVVLGDTLYLFGTGAYRKSDVHLARKPVASLAKPGGFERFDAATRQWVSANSVGAPIVRSGGVGELSVRYFPSIHRFVMLDQELRPGDNQIIARFADAVTGPWSDPVTVASFTDPAFRAKYCCVAGDCAGERLFNCEKAGFYGTFMLADLANDADGSFTIDFTMSTWDPYNVALMSATFR